MRKLALLFLVAFALPSFAATYGTIVIRDGDHHYADGDSNDFAETANLGRQYAFSSAMGSNMSFAMLIRSPAFARS